MESLIHEAYAAIPRHGPVVMFLAALLSCAGAPIPTSAMMLASGALIAAGDMALATVFAATLVGAMIGDQIGFFAGRYGGAPLWERLRARPRLTAPLDRAAQELDKRAEIAVIISRFPLSAIGPSVNLVAGSTGVKWSRFTLGVAVGDTVWVVIYLVGGTYFADRVKALGTTMTSVLGAMAALAMAAALGHLIWRRRRG